MANQTTGLTPEEMRAKKRAWNHAHPENVRAANAKYWQTRAAQKLADDGNENPDAETLQAVADQLRRDNLRQWRAENPEKVRAAQIRNKKTYLEKKKGNAKND